ncbi:MAG: pentapeptide repeat-containing protein [Candidatus Nanopelagicales bacterium]
MVHARRRPVVRVLAVSSLLVGAVVATGTSASAAPVCPVIDASRTIQSDIPVAPDWSGCDVHGVTLSLQNLDGGKFVGTDFSGATFYSASLVGVNLTNANLGGANLGSATISGATVTGATFTTGTSTYRLTTSSLTGTPSLPTGWAVRAGALLAPGVSFAHAVAGADLRNLDLHGADLQGSDLHGADLTGSDLSGVLLQHVDLTGVTAPQVSFRESLLDGATLASADLTGADLGATGLTGVDLSAVKATGAGFASATFASDTWTGADLSGADLTDAVITTPATDLAGATFTGATWLRTLCPDGYRSFAHIGGTCLGARDVVAPVTTMTAPVGPYTIDATIPWAFSVTETGTAVDQAWWAWGASRAGTTAATSWATEAPADIVTRKGTKVGVAGYRYCFRARTFDVAGNWGVLSAPRCTTLPLDDWSLTATATFGRVRNAAGYLGRTYSTTTKLGAYVASTSVLTARQVGIVATRCATCGAVAVYVGATKVGTISLASSVARSRALLLLPRFTTARRGVVKVVVISTGKLVRVDGLVVSAY